MQPRERRHLPLRKLIRILSPCSPHFASYFVDLFVRVTNTVATEMYTRLGYTVYRRVLQYYGGDEVRGLPGRQEMASVPGVFS